MKRFLALWLVLILLSWHLIPAQAARTFADNQYLSVATALVSGPPLTACVWAYSTLGANTGGIFGLVQGGSDQKRIGIRHDASAALYTESREDGTFVSHGVSGFTDNVWHHTCGVWASNSSRQGFLDGATAAADTTAITVTLLDTTLIGRYTGGATDLEWNGHLGVAGVWNVALSPNEISALAGGVHPRKVQPTALLSCPQVYGTSPEVDFCGARSWTLNGAPTVATTGPPVSLFSHSLGR
jgi:hypothetical protein